MANFLVPMVGPTTVFVEDDMVIPRLVERIAELEARLLASATDTTVATDESLAGRFQSLLQAAAHGVDAGLSYITGEDVRRAQIQNEATDRALMITVRKLGQLTQAVASLEAQLQQAQEALSAAQCSAQTASEEAQSARELAAQAEATAAQVAAEMSLRVATEAAGLEAERATLAAVASAAQAEAAGLRSEVALWKAQAEEAAAQAQSNIAEASQARAARAAATHDLHALRSQLADVQLQAEDFQRRFLAERLERRRLHEELQALRGNIRVVCRVRPPLPSARAPQALAVSFPVEAAIKVRASERWQQEFEFSAVLEPSASQDRVFDEVWPALRSCADGYNCTIFAYGQTGSGKTHTVLGSNGEDGVAPRALRALFETFEKEAQDAPGSTQRVISVSMLEIYNETVRDLLCSGGPSDAQQSSLGSPGSRRTGASLGAVLEVSALGPFTPEQVAAGAERVPGRTWRTASRPEDALAVLEEGLRARATAATALNASSSRSHALLCLKIVDPSRELPTAALNLVDLAGSERVAKSEAEGTQMKEAQAINKSLSALGSVVAALQERAPHVPFRNAKLTSVLQDSLGGSSKVLLVCCVAPEAEFAAETLSTLAFAQRASQTELGPARRVGDVGGAKQRSSPYKVKTPSPTAPLKQRNSL